MIALIEREQGFPRDDAVGRTKRELSMHEVAKFRFSGVGVEIDAEVRRSDFEAGIPQDLRRIEAALDTAPDRAEITPDQIDRVFLTGGLSLLPTIRAIFQLRFRIDQISTGDKLTSIVHGLAQREANRTRRRGSHESSGLMGGAFDEHQVQLDLILGGQSALYGFQLSEFD